VEGLGDRHGVDRRVLQRQRLGGAVAHVDAGHGRLELGAHGGDRLDGHDLGAGGDEQPRQLARPRRQVEGPSPGPDAAVADDVRRRLGRVRGPRPLVGGGVVVEPVGLVLDRHAASLATQSSVKTCSPYGKPRDGANSAFHTISRRLK
jgi:hypothetical protein